MLLALSLQDFVLVEKLDLDFQGGFTVLTGETGAGKSVTLDAVGLLLGDKADYAQVRTGAPFCPVRPFRPARFGRRAARSGAA